MRAPIRRFRTRALILSLAAAPYLFLMTSAIKADQPDGPPPAPPTQDDDHGRPVEAIAKDLGVTPEQFREAFKKVHPAGRGQEPTEEQRQANRKALSEALHVSPEKLDAVMDKYRPGGRGTNGPKNQNGTDDQNGPPHRQHRGPGGSTTRPSTQPSDHDGPPPGDADNRPPRDGDQGPPQDGQHGPPIDQMAKELGVSPEKLREVMEKYRPRRRDDTSQGNNQHDGPPGNGPQDNGPPPPRD